MSLLSPLLLVLALGDPRVDLSDLVLRDQYRAALVASEDYLTEHPEEGRELGLDYLRGRLLDRLGRHQEAVAAYAQTMAFTPGLKPYAHLRLALDQERMGHPELATGMMVTLLASRPPRTLLQPATRLLSRSLAKGGDCRHLDSLSPLLLPNRERRVVDLARADCSLRLGRKEEAKRHYLNLLQEDRTDLSAHHAAERLAALSPAPGNLQVVFLLGLTFHRHRDFNRSSRYLRQVVVSFTSTLPGPDVSPRPAPLTSEEFDIYYQLVRSFFWQGNFAAAASGFGQLAQRTQRSREKARALYNQGRSFELLGDWGTAADSYRRGYLADVEGRLASAALISAMRLEWRRGQAESAGELLELLGTKRQWRREAFRAALFVGVSELVRGRLDSAQRWLSVAERRASSRDQVEVAYWKGRLEESRSSSAQAVEHYLRAVRGDGGYHPLAQAAWKRLASPALAVAVRVRAEALAGSPRSEDLRSLWILLGEDHPSGAQARQDLKAHFLAQRGTAPFVGLAPVAVQDWPLWKEPLSRPSEKLLALGMWEEGAPAVRRHFPLAHPDLAFTASGHLRSAGQVRASLLMAEILSERIPNQLPPSLIPREYRRLLYPFPYRSLVVGASRRHGTDPYLLAAIIREESRFDPEAVSAASARGLTQLVFSTAQRVAKATGFGPISPNDLENPRVAIELGAAYLSELSRHFDGASHQVVAAYNAGEAQAQLWQTYCYSRETDEYLAKVSFVETRNYLQRVLTSRAHYAELYGEESGLEGR